MEDRYRLSELAALVGATPRTIRFYIAEGLLPPPSGTGPAAAYTSGHRDRLLLIGRLKARYLPLSDIRQHLSAQSDAEIRAALQEAERETVAARTKQATPSPPAADAARQPRDASNTRPAGERWERFVLSDGIEVHVRADRHREWVLLDTLIRQARALLNDEN